jgi:hypothetical protein
MEADHPNSGPGAHALACGVCLGEAAQVMGFKSAELTFPLQMHPGMEGRHRFDVHVPVGAADEFLTLGVTGNFG